MRKQVFIFLIPFILLSGCAELNTLMQSVSTDIPLTEAEVVEGLKEALICGTKNAASLLSAVDGYYGDELVKIMLPAEASVIIDNLAKIPGGDKLVQDVVLSINRAAEDAAKEVAPIFVSTIKQMTINDAFGILKGADNAATQYLVSTTRDDLYALYAPKIRQSTEKDVMGGISAKDSWELLTGKWNKLANSIAGKLAGLDPVNTELDNYLTNKALDGMFLMVSVEEKKIREDVSARVSPLLKKVFGQAQDN